MLDKKTEQGLNTKFHVKLKKTTTETSNLLRERYGENSSIRARVSE